MVRFVRALAAVGTVFAVSCNPGAPSPGAVPDPAERRATRDVAPSGRGPKLDAAMRLGPFRLDDLTVTPRIERGGEATVKAKARLVVVAPAPTMHSVAVLVRCQFREHRLIARSDLATVDRLEFSAKDGGRSYDVFVRAPLSLGWLGRPTACELSFRLGDADEAGSEQAPDATACWTLLGVRAGRCAPRALPTVAGPSAGYALHGVDGEATRESVSFRAHLQRGDAPDRAALLHASLGCGSPATIPVDVAPFSFGAGESVALSFTVPASAIEGGCPVVVTASSPSREGGPEVSVALGQWCVRPGGAMHGLCGA